MQARCLRILLRGIHGREATQGETCIRLLIFWNAILLQMRGYLVNSRLDDLLI